MKSFQSTILAVVSCRIINAGFSERMLFTAVRMTDGGHAAEMFTPAPIKRSRLQKHYSLASETGLICSETAKTLQ